MYNTEARVPMCSIMTKNMNFGFKHVFVWGAGVTQFVKYSTSAQVMISGFVGSSPALDSVLTAQSLEPASESVSPSLSAPPPLTLSLSLSLSKINKTKQKKILAQIAF